MARHTNEEEPVVIKQIEVGNFGIFCYLIGDEKTGEGLFIDPSDGHEMLLKEAAYTRFQDGLPKYHSPPIPAASGCIPAQNSTTRRR